MKKTFYCSHCNKRLFDVVGGEPRTAILIKCPRCKSISSFDYRAADEVHQEKVKEAVVKDSDQKSH